MEWQRIGAFEVYIVAGSSVVHVYDTNRNYTYCVCTSTGGGGATWDSECPEEVRAYLIQKYGSSCP
jgi:hypothetical protein